MNSIICTKCGSYDIMIDISDYSVKCKKCKHEFKVDKNEKYLED